MGSSLDSCGRTACPVAGRGPVTVRKGRVCALSGTESAHSSAMSTAGAPRPTRRGPLRLPGARPAARGGPLAHELPGLPYELTWRGRTWEPDGAGSGRRSARVPVRAGPPQRPLGAGRRPRQPAARLGPVGRQVGARAPGYRPPHGCARADRRAGADDDLRAASSRRTLRRSAGRIPTRRAQPAPRRARRAGVRRALRLLTLLGRLPPLRAVLLAPVDRNEIYSASRATRARSRRRSCPHSARRAFGSASARASARSRSCTRTGGTRRAFDALFLQSGSFFRRRDRHERWFPRFDRISRFIGQRCPAGPASARSR